MFTLHCGLRSPRAQFNILFPCPWLSTMELALSGNMELKASSQVIQYFALKGTDGSKLPIGIVYSDLDEVFPHQRIG